MTLLKDLLDDIRTQATRKTHYEEFENDAWGYNPGDNGNYDDAHGDGIEDGYIHLARDLMKKYPELFAENP